MDNRAILIFLILWNVIWTLVSLIVLAGIQEQQAQMHSLIQELITRTKINNLYRVLKR